MRAQVSRGARVPALVGLVAALSLVDAAFSVALRGSFFELNPLLRPLLVAPAAFVVVKAALTLAGLWLLARVAGSGLTRAVLVAAAIAYAAVDVQWLAWIGR